MLAKRAVETEPGGAPGTLTTLLLPTALLKTAKGQFFTRTSLC
jgi:hypothetical protein